MPSLIDRRQRPPLQVGTAIDGSGIAGPSSPIVELVMLPSSSPLTHGSSAELESGSCFVCEDGGEVFAVCGCADRLVHLECQKAMMQKTSSHRNGCPVCMMQYNNVTSTITRRTISQEGRRLIAFLTGVGAVVAIGAYECAMFVHMNQPAFLAVAIVFFVSALGFLCAGRRIFATSALMIEDRTVCLGRPQPGRVGAAMAPEASPSSPLPEAGAGTAANTGRDNTSSVVAAAGWTWRRRIFTVLLPSPRARSPRSRSPRSRSPRSRSPRIAAVELEYPHEAAEPPADSSARAESPRSRSPHSPRVTAEELEAAMLAT